jgi:hypothetical protein
MIMRYATLAALAAASIWAVINASASNGQWLLVDAGHTAAGPGGAPNDVAFWLLAAVATLITLSLARFVFFGLPSMFGGWYQERKQWIYMLVCGGLLYAVFYLM